MITMTGNPATIDVGRYNLFYMLVDKETKTVFHNGGVIEVDIDFPIMIDNHNMTLHSMLEHAMNAQFGLEAVITAFIPINV